MENLQQKNNHRFAKIIASTIFVALIAFGIMFLYSPIQDIENIKSDLSNHKHTQIQYINNNMDIVPKIISISKGYIIKNNSALKDIIQINILTKTQNNNISDIYINQIQILTLTNKIIGDAIKTPPLANNSKFKELYKKFSDLYTTAIDGYNHCLDYSAKLGKYMQKPIYKNLVNPKDLQDILCIQKI